MIGTHGVQLSGSTLRNRRPILRAHPANEQDRYILLQEGVYIISHGLEYRDAELIVVAQVHDCADLTPAREVVMVPAGEIVCGGERV